MRGTFARTAVLCGLCALLLSGCNRDRLGPGAEPPPAVPSVSTGSVDPAGAAEDADDLLNELDQQMSADAQPAQDED